MAKKKKQTSPQRGYLDADFPAPALTTQYCYELSQWLYEHFSKDQEVLMATIHGSYLYGTAHENSDLDCYIVTLDGENTHTEYTTRNGYVIDVRRNDLHRYTELLKIGAHQAVEAFNSPYAVWNTESIWFPYLKAHRTSFGAFAMKCLSASESFIASAQHNEEKQEKMLRHAQRLEDGVLMAAEKDGYYHPVWKPLG